MSEATFQIEGYRVTLSWNSPEVEPAVREIQWPNFQPCELKGEATLSIKKKGEQYEIAWDGELRKVSALEHLSYYLAKLIQSRVARHAPDLVFLRAGVVKVNHRLVVIPGRSFQGKSTLVQELCRGGAVYYSDDYAIVEESGLVRPWPRPLALRTNDGEFFNSHTAQELGWGPEHGRAAVGLVVFTSYRAGSIWTPVPIRPAEAILDLMVSTATLKMKPNRTIKHLKAMLGEATSYKGPRGDAREAATWILGRAKGLSL